MKKIYSFLLVMLVAFILVGCGEKVTLTLNEADKQITLEEETNKKVTPVVTGEATLVWESSNPNVATVNNGIITAIAPGTANITVSVQDKADISATIKVTVTAKPIDYQLSVSEKTVSLQEGDTKTITPTYTDGATLVWETSNSDVATVANGVITAVAVGEAKITVSIQEKPEVKQEITVTVTEKVWLVETITVSLSSNSIYIGETVEVSATVLPVEALQEVEWSLSDSSLATMENGVITAVGSGLITVKASAKDGSGVIGETNLQIYEIVQDITIQGDAKLDVDEETILIVSATNSGAKEVFTFASSDETLATVDADGKVTALAAGTVTITVTANDSGQCSKTFEITIREKVVETHKKTWTDSYGRVFVGSAVYESDYAKLAQIFINDWNTKYTTELTVESLTTASKTWWDSARTASQTSWEGSKLKDFFQDTEMSAKWSWLLDMILDYTGNSFSKAQIMAIQSNTEDSSNWYFGAHLISDIMSFLSGSTQTSGYGGYNFTNNTAKALTTFDQYNRSIEADVTDAELVEITGSITVPAIEAKEGYTAEYVDTFGTAYVEGDSIPVAENTVIEIVYTPVTYNITLMWDDMELTTISYTIEEAVTLDPTSMLGYIFKGWYDNAELTGDPVTSIAKGSIGDKTFYALMIESEYYEVNVTFDANYKFATWEELTAALLADINEAGGTEFTADSFFEQSKWTSNEVAINKLITEEKYSHWRTLAEATLNYEAGNNVDGMRNWADGVANSGSQNPFAASYVARAIIKATVYDSNANFITADYSNLDVQATILAAVSGPKLTAKYSTPEAITETITRAGYTFAGWYTNPECTGDAVVEFPGFKDGTTEVTYYAKWEVAETEPETGTGTETEPETGTETEPETGTETEPETEPETGTGTETEPETGTGTETEPETGTGTETE